ncbi:Ig-like domain-containing protein, partial [Aureibaculum conchae]
VGLVYTYTVAATAPCTGNDTATVTVTEQAPTISISNGPTCSLDLLTYSVEVTVSSGTVTSTSGTVTNTSGNIWIITNISAGTNITLTAEDADTCTNTLAITAPNCSCPVVTAPTSGGNQEYCTGDAIPTLTASVGAGETVDWYVAATGGTALDTGTSYTPGSAGTYYAEARNTTTNCVSATRTAVTVTENALPTAPVSGGNQTECAAIPAQTLTSTATAPGGSSVVWYDAATGGNVVATPTLSTIGTVTYYAGSTDNTTNCESATRTAVTLTIQDCDADLSLRKTVDNSTPDVGDNITFTITLRNDGPSDANTIIVRDIIPGDFTYTHPNFVTSQGTVTFNAGTGALTWDLGAYVLTNGSSITLTYTVTVDVCGEFKNQVEIIQSSQSDPDSTPNNGN